MKRVNEFSESKIPTWLWIVSIPVFPLSGVLMYMSAKKIKARCDELGIECKDMSTLSLVFGLLGLGLVAYIVQQIKLNKIVDTE